MARPQLARLMAGSAVAGAMLLCAPLACAEEPVEPVRPTHNLFGMTGLIDTPTADIQPDGQLSVTVGYFGGFLRNTISAQILPGIEAAFRYSVINDFTALPGGGRRDLFDRSFDIKARFIRESDMWPSVAIGLQDFLGTGIYSSEYIVATKGFEAGSLGAFRLTGGLGWGRFADTNGIKNPFRVFSNRFNNRESDFGVGGNVNFGQYFSGPDVGLFGGIEWQTPIEGLSAKVEYSGDQYVLERVAGGFDPKAQINVGLDYKVSDGVEVGAYYLYGSEVGVRLSISGNPFRPVLDHDTVPGPQPLTPRDAPAGGPRLASLGDVMSLLTGEPPQASISDARLQAVTVHNRLGTVRWAEAVMRADAPDRCPDELAKAIDAEYGVIDVVTFNRASGGVVCTIALRPAGQHAVRLTSRVHAAYPTDWYEQPVQRQQLVELLAEELAAERIGLFGIEIGPRRVEVYIENGQFRSQPRAIGRTARALARVMPASVEIFEITPVEDSLPVSTIVLQRSALEEQVERPDAARRAWATAQIKDAKPVAWGDLAGHGDEFPRFSWNLSPSTPFNLFDPDQPVRFDLSAVASGKIEFLPGLSLNARVSQRLIGDLDDIERDSDSLVRERVRSDIAEYLSATDTALTRLTVDYITKLTPSIYGRLSGGNLERMFAGVSGEILWKPATQDWGLGLELNYVRQRGFNTQFDYRDYDTGTGHASVYWDTNWYGLSTQVDVGRYLAGDWGATFGVKRRFDNGWELGGFFTLTDIPFSEFGEGSFDKGLFLTIPFNWLLPYQSRTEFSTVLRPLTRDGGQRLVVSNRLYDVVEDQDRGGYRSTWKDFWE